MSENLWAGLVTNASPYALPGGAATEQVNLTSSTPGQLASRGGMRAVAFTSAAPEMRECYPYVFGNTVRILALNPSGQIVALSTPSYGSAPSSPLNPALAPSAGEVQSNYVGAFHDYDGEPPQ